MMATTPWPPAAQMLITPRPVPSSCSCFGEAGDDPPAGRGERVPGGERAAVDVELARGRSSRAACRDRAARGRSPGPPRPSRCRGPGRRRPRGSRRSRSPEVSAGAVEHARHRVGGCHQQALALVDVVDRGGLALDEVGEHRQVALLGPLLGGEQYRARRRRRAESSWRRSSSPRGRRRPGFSLASFSSEESARRFWSRSRPR